MAGQSRGEIAFSRPGGETCPTWKSRPIDLDHLRRQTMGDRNVEQQVLAMFMQQLSSVREQLARANHAERQILAHGLKGSARSMGAGAIADCAAGIEDDPGSAAILRRLSARIDEAREFVAAISR